MPRLPRWLRRLGPVKGRRCHAYPLDQVRCARTLGHPGRHTLYPADVVDAGYERKPF